MAAFAYVLLPVTGLVAFLTGRTPRIRFHGLQAISLGLLWPLALYAAAPLGSLPTLVVAVLGALTWLVLFLGAALGRDPAIPLLGRQLERVARGAPGEFRSVRRN